MSLLLDALKKSAKDKQQVAQRKTVNDDSTTNSAIELTVDETTEFKEPALQESPSQISSSSDKNTAQDSESLTLDPVDIESVQGESAITFDESDVAHEHEHAEPVPRAGKKQGAANNTVSDEALSVLIYKTNRDLKKGKQVAVISVVLVSLAVLVSGGIYYYFDMQAEMASLERKHQIAMRAMRLKTSDENNVPEKSEIIRSFVDKTEPEDKVKLAKKHIASKELISEKRLQKKTAAKANLRGQKNNNSSVSVQRTSKSDPIGEKLDAAWLAYENGQYDASEKLYMEVLGREKNNRDALLGLGAIAIHKKEPATARKHYLALLKLDPRDPIASAAIASLHSDKTSIATDEKYLLSMQEKNPDDAHLNFALGNIYAQKGEWKSAQQSYFIAWQQDNENADYVFNLAISMDQLGKRQQALKFYTESLQKSSGKQVSFSREVARERIKVLSEI
ncbi:MAG: tetratricopeptide repeat protein [Gammaproteobacteria bacterium]|nr:tetratricopeptide repeat protein [Gammaproteobacteria bacterium]